MSVAKFVAFYRVSTARPGRSASGLEAQRQSVADYLRGNGTIVEEFTEIESGRSADRAELRKALAACRREKAKLCVAKFDRISRNAAFLLALRNGNVECVAVDFPDANSLIVGILAVVAQHEAEAISARTKAALQVAKKRGTKLGNPAHLNEQARTKGRRSSAKVRDSNATEWAMDRAPIVEQLRQAGAKSLRELAAGLNARKTSTVHGGKWSATQVQRLLRRIDAASPNTVHLSSRTR